ncbi:MAG: winged helix-turn-helix domain-containing protein [Elusimicrobiota bacterium]
MINEEIIGTVAGKVWQYLNTNGATAVLKLKFELSLDNRMLFLSLGWLAREGKIVLQPDLEAKDVIVDLNK